MGIAAVNDAGVLIITSYVLPAAMKTSLCTRGTPGNGFPSSAIRENPEVPVPVCEPTIEGTCMRRPALTIRTRIVPVPAVRPEAGLVGNSEADGLVLLKATPLTR